MSTRPTKVNIHPLVLLSIVDHFNRVNITKRDKRVVGALLGEQVDNVVEITNSYAVVYEEDPNEPNIWYLDHLYHETMFDMFKKINAKERFIGWYATGGKFKSQDIIINDIFRKYNPTPVFIVVDVEHQNEIDLPTEAYVAQEEIGREGSVIKSFFHIESSVEAYEPEEIGVEHLLREIKDIALNSIESNIHSKVQALKGLSGKIESIRNYLAKVREGKMPLNNKVMGVLQEIVNLLPNLNSEELIHAYSAKNNDLMFSIYICAMARSVLSLHTLLFISKREDE